MTSALIIHNNEVNQRFEMELHPELAFLEYRWYKGSLALMHTFVPDGHEGKGIAGALARHGLEFARQKEARVLVYCPFVAGFIKRHPEYGSLVIRSEDAG
jgi:predicted GNAT family acetyltransferase